MRRRVTGWSWETFVAGVSQPGLLVVAGDPAWPTFSPSTPPRLPGWSPSQTTSGATQATCTARCAKAGLFAPRVLSVGAAQRDGGQDELDGNDRADCSLTLLRHWDPSRRSG